MITRFAAGLALVLAVLPPPSSVLAGSSLRVGKDVDLQFTEGLAVGTAYPAGFVFTNSGSAGTEVTATALYANLGKFKAVAGRGTGNFAIAAPAHITSPTGTPKSAVIRISNATATDLLDPGTDPFSFGADFNLNTLSSTPDSKDNGDNLIQRGLANSATQYKIQIDAGKPSCVLRQGTTTITAKATQVIERGTWYRVVCQRTAAGGVTTVSLTVTRLSTGALVPTTPGTGALLDLSIATTVPMSVGGKLSDTGNVILSATDQFNGRIDNAFLDLP